MTNNSQQKASVVTGDYSNGYVLNLVYSQTTEEQHHFVIR